MSNYKNIDNDEMTAVFINEKKEIPKSIIPLGIYDYRIIEYGKIMVLELCQYVYILDDAIAYSILKWHPRSVKSESMASIQLIIDAQKGIKDHYT